MNKNSVFDDSHRVKLFNELRKYLSHFNVSDELLSNAVSHLTLPTSSGDYQWGVYNYLLRKLISLPDSEDKYRALGNLYFRMAIFKKREKKESSEITDLGHAMLKKADEMKQSRLNEYIKNQSFDDAP